jgi:RimJ/RimL family protein N-acetyltransferase
MIEGDGFRLRRARPDDVDFLVRLASHDEVEPFLAPVGAQRDEVLAEVERSLAEPEVFGRFLLEIAAGGEWIPAGALGFHSASRHSRIARLEGLAVHPDHRGCGLADAAARLLQRHLLFDLDYHRLELECYGFNERAIRHAERSGFVREGVKRKAYWRHGEWVDGVLFGLVREDLEPGV